MPRSISSLLMQTIMYGHQDSFIHSESDLWKFEAEYELIQKKKSTQSSANRKRTVRIWEGILKKREAPPKEKSYPVDKGRRDGSCNMSSCLKPGADWYNRGSLAWYCRKCAQMINEANEIFSDVQRNFPDGQLCHLNDEVEGETKESQ